MKIHVEIFIFLNGYTVALQIIFEGAITAAKATELRFDLLNIHFISPLALDLTRDLILI